MASKKHSTENKASDQALPGSKPAAPEQDSFIIATPHPPSDVRCSAAFHAFAYRFLVEDREWSLAEVEAEFDQVERSHDAIRALDSDGFMKAEGDQYRPAGSLDSWFELLDIHAAQFRGQVPDASDAQVAERYQWPEYIVDAVLSDGENERAYRASLTSELKSKQSRDVEPEGGAVPSSSALPELTEDAASPKTASGPTARIEPSEQIEALAVEFEELETRMLRARLGDLGPDHTPRSVLQAFLDQKLDEVASTGHFGSYDVNRAFCERLRACCRGAGLRVIHEATGRFGQLYCNKVSEGAGQFQIRWTNPETKKRHWLTPSTASLPRMSLHEMS